MSKREDTQDMLGKSRQGAGGRAGKQAGWAGGQMVSKQTRRLAGIGAGTVPSPRGEPGTLPWPFPSPTTSTSPHPHNSPPPLFPTSPTHHRTPLLIPPHAIQTPLPFLLLIPKAKPRTRANRSLPPPPPVCFPSLIQDYSFNLPSLTQVTNFS